MLLLVILYQFRQRRSILVANITTVNRYIKINDWMNSNNFICLGETRNNTWRCQTQELFKIDLSLYSKPLLYRVCRLTLLLKHLRVKPSVNWTAFARDTLVFLYNSLSIFLVFLTLQNNNGVLIITGVKIITGSMKSNSFCVEITIVFSDFSEFCYFVSYFVYFSTFRAQRVTVQFPCLSSKLPSFCLSLFVNSAPRLLRRTSEIFNACLYGGKWKSNDFKESPASIIYEVTLA